MNTHAWHGDNRVLVSPTESRRILALADRRNERFSALSRFSVEAAHFR